MSGDHRGRVLLVFDKEDVFKKKNKENTVQQ